MDLPCAWGSIPALGCGWTRLASSSLALEPFRRIRIFQCTEVFHESAENSARGTCASHFNLGFRVTMSAGSKGPMRTTVSKPEPTFDGSGGTPIRCAGVFAASPVKSVCNIK